jgi:7,8-dihydroneopterin aldolase/epimerase/oxygenase
MKRVFIRNLEAYAHIGVHSHEQGKTQLIRINVDLDVEDAREFADKLESVVDYEALATRIHAILGTGHFNLAETLAERIAATCFEDARVRNARIRVEKLRVLPGAESAGVEIERERK